MFHRVLVVLLALALLAAPVRALTVEITHPQDGEVVAGVVTILGTTSDLGNGVVAISIDGGPFVNAAGKAAWSFAWDTASISDGVHTITARARQCVTCTPVFDEISVVVQNLPAGLAVSILNPTEGQTISTTLVMSGVSNGATQVAVAVDDGPFQPANGTASWDFVFEPGSLATGPHSLVARATDGVGEVFDAVNIIVGAVTPGQQAFTYFSSVDGAPMDGVVYVPKGYSPQNEPVGLICYLHGGGGLGSVPQDWPDDLDARGWILIAPDGRKWPLADPKSCPSNPNAIGECSWCTSAAYVDNPFDPLVGPGERDILDAIDWARANFTIDADRIYLSGFSMGGRGTYQIGLRHPDLFAAIAPLSPASDMYEIFDRRPDPVACKEGMVSDGMGGGRPGDSLVTDTLYTITSARFLIENSYNLPVLHCHGTLDSVAYNIPGTPDQYLHGSHMVDDATWDACHDSAGLLCFGHTPTLAELRDRHPLGYDWDHRFTPVQHQRDESWTPAIFDFFAARTLVRAPDTVVYKSYTDQHRKAYWCQIDHESPWTDAPAAIRATRNSLNNRIDAEVARVATATFDLPLAGIAFTGSRPLTISIRPLVEPVFDPAIADAPTPAPSLVLLGDFGAIRGVAVLRNGSPDPTIPVEITATEVRLGPVPAPELTTIELRALLSRSYSAAADPVPYCRADYDRNGVLDMLDLAAFTGDYSSAASGPGGYAVPCTGPNPAGFKADWNGDCMLTDLDVVAYTTAYMNGC